MGSYGDGQGGLSGGMHEQWERECSLNEEGCLSIGDGSIDLGLELGLGLDYT